MTPDRPLAAGIRARPRRVEPLPWLKPGIFVGGIVPLASLVVRGSQDALGANPIAQAINELGLTALIFLIATLACTPAKLLLGWTWPIRIRRMLGLFAFFYAVVHFLTYLILDQGLDMAVVVEDIAERPFITVGFVALLLLVPLALTSTKAWVRRLGYRRWQQLHRLIYVAGILAVIHFIWRVKIDVSQPATYAAVLAILLATRLLWWLRKRAIAARESS